MNSRVYFSYVQNSFRLCKRKPQISLRHLLSLQMQELKKSAIIKDISKTVTERLGSEALILLALAGLQGKAIHFALKISTLLKGHF